MPQVVNKSAFKDEDMLQEYIKKILKLYLCTNLKKTKSCLS